MNLKIISAGAGSGKTYRLTQEMVKLLSEGVRASGIIATTFTSKAAAELQERVRTKLLEEQMIEQADDLSNALIGTVHGLGVKLLKRFAYEAGVSPDVDIIADEDQQVLFNQSLAMVLKQERVEKMEQLCDSLGLNKKGTYDWRKQIKTITEIARANGFQSQQLEASKIQSYATFEPFLGAKSNLSLAAYQERLLQIIDDTTVALDQNEDSTKVTQKAITLMRSTKRDLKLKGKLYWWEIVKLSKVNVGAKSKDEVFELKEYAARHEQLQAFRQDIKDYIYLLFDLAKEAIEEFDRYKKQRGLIDYTDMEVYIKDLLDHPQVKAVLAEELDLLMVDEFQDTSPIQLEIFLKLSQLAQYSIWVGDPKQSIYGFRGAEPELMQAVIQKNGGVKAEDIQENSWRSREDIVFCTNALFTKAFKNLPLEQVALKPMRSKKTNEPFFSGDPIEANEALIHWHFKTIEKTTTNQDWVNNCIADAIVELIEKKTYILPKSGKTWRAAKAGDVAVLCRSNKECLAMAEALHRAGLQAAISRAGLLETAEAKLILACLKYILTQHDTLSIAEILLLASKQPIESIIEDRLKYLKEKEEGLPVQNWASNDLYIKHLDRLREEVKELSSSEILNLLLDELDLRRIIAAWGKTEQRLDNIDVLRKMATDYEEACNRLHSAASLGGFLLWLNEVENNGEDKQASGENEDAVNVMTYHRSKGLEFPVLICHSLEQNLRADLWGSEIVSEREEVDLEDVLGGRWLRFWVNPYSDQYKKTSLEERLLESPFYQKKRQQALEEEARLLYVGITRARDYLIFPSRNKPMKWLNRVWHDGNEGYPTLEADQSETPWQWNGQFLNIRPQTFTFDKSFQTAEIAPKAIRHIEAADGQQEHKVYKIDLRTEHWEEDIDLHIAHTKTYASAVKIEEDDQKYVVAKALKAFFIADQLEYETNERLKMAQTHLDRFKVEEDLEAKHFVAQSDAFFNQIRLVENVQQERKYVIQFHWQKRLFETVIDFIYITDNQIIVYQNSSFSGDAKRYRKHAKEQLGAWTFLTQKALQSLFPNKSIEIWTNFVLGGVCLQLKADLVGEMA